MGAQITVRLPDDMGKDISGIARRMHLKRSDIVRMALERFVREIGGEKEGKPYDRVKDFIGSISSGVKDLGESHRKYLVERIKKSA